MNASIVNSSSVPPSSSIYLLRPKKTENSVNLNIASLQKKPLFTCLNEIDRLRYQLYQEGLVDGEQRLIHQAKTPDLCRYPQVIKRMQTYLNAECEIMGNPLEKIKKIFQTYEEYEFPSNTDSFTIRFQLNELFSYLIHNNHLRNLIKGFYIVGGKAIHLIGIEYAKDVLAAAYQKESASEKAWLSSSFIKELQKIPPDNDTQIDSSGVDLQGRMYILDSILSFWVSKMSPSFNYLNYFQYIQMLQKERYAYLNPYDILAIQIAAIREFGLEKYAENPPNELNRLSMMGINNQLGAPHDFIVIEHFEKKCLNSRGAFRLKLTPKHDIFEIEADTSEPKISTAQVFHDRNVQVLYIPDRNKVEKDDWGDTILRTGTYSLIQDNIESDIYKKTISQKHPYKKTTDFFCDILCKWWKNHANLSCSLIAYLVRASRNLKVFGNMPDAHVQELWKMMLDNPEIQQKQQSPIESCLQKGILDFNVPFTELMAWQEALLFFFSQSALTTWEVDKPIYRYQEMLIPFSPIESMLLIEKQIFPKIRNKQADSSIFTSLLSLVIENGDTPSYPSLWMDFQDQLNFTASALYEIANRWIKDENPSITYFGFCLYLSIPNQELKEDVVSLMIEQFPKLFPFADYFKKETKYVVKKIQSALSQSQKHSLTMKQPLFQQALLLLEDKEKLNWHRKYGWMLVLTASHDPAQIQSACKLLSHHLKTAAHHQNVEKVIGLKLFRKQQRTHLKEALALFEQLYMVHSIDKHNLLKCLVVSCLSLKQHPVKDEFCLSVCIDMAFAVLEGEEQVNLQQELSLASQASKAFSWLIHELHQRDFQMIIGSLSKNKAEVFCPACGDDLLMALSKSKLLHHDDCVGIWLTRLEQLLNDEEISASALFFRQAFVNGFICKEEKYSYHQRLKTYLSKLIESLSVCDESNLLLNQDFYSHLTSKESNQLGSSQLDQLFLNLIEKQLKAFQHPLQLFEMIEKMVETQSVEQKQTSFIFSKLVEALNKNFLQLNPKYFSHLDRLYLLPQMNEIYAQDINVLVDYLMIFLRKEQSFQEKSKADLLNKVLQVTLTTPSSKEKGGVFILKFLDYSYRHSFPLPLSWMQFLQENQTVLLEHFQQKNDFQSAVQFAAHLYHFEAATLQALPLIEQLCKELLNSSSEFEKGADLLSLVISKQQKRLRQDRRYFDYFLLIAKEKIRSEKADQALFWLLHCLEYPLEQREELSLYGLQCANLLIAQGLHAKAYSLLKKLLPLKEMDVNQVGILFLKVLEGFISGKLLNEASLLILSHADLCAKQPQKFLSQVKIFIQECLESDPADVKLEAVLSMLQQYEIPDSQSWIKLFEHISLSSNASLKEKAWRCLNEFVQVKQLISTKSRGICLCHALKGLESIQHPDLLRFIDSNLSFYHDFAIYFTHESVYLALRHIMTGAIPQVVKNLEQLESVLDMRSILAGWGWNYQVEVDCLMIQHLIDSPSPTTLFHAYRIIQDLLDRPDYKTHERILIPFLVKFVQIWSIEKSDVADQSVLSMIRQARESFDLQFEAAKVIASLIQRPSKEGFDEAMQLCLKLPGSNQVNEKPSFQCLLSEMVFLLKKQGEKTWQQKWWQELAPFINEWIVKRDWTVSVFEKMESLFFYVLNHVKENESSIHFSRQEEAHTQFCTELLKWMLSKQLPVGTKKCTEYLLLFNISVENQRATFFVQECPEAMDSLFDHLTKINTPYSIYKAIALLSAVKGSGYQSGYLKHFETLIQKSEQFPLYLFDEYSLFAHIYHILKPLEKAEMKKVELPPIHKLNFLAVHKAIKTILQKGIEGRLKGNSYLINSEYLKAYMELSAALAVSFLNTNGAYPEYLKLVKAYGLLVKQISYTRKDEGYSLLFLSLLAKGRQVSKHAEDPMACTKSYNQLKHQQQRAKLFTDFLEQLTSPLEDNKNLLCLSAIYDYAEKMILKARKLEILHEKDKEMQQMNSIVNRTLASWLHKIPACKCQTCGSYCSSA
jgi:hypothetical protein